MPALFARIMRAQYTFPCEFCGAHDTFPHDFSAHALCALFFPAKKRFCAYCSALYTANRKNKKVRARINLHIQHPSAGNRHFSAHTCAFDTFILAVFPWCGSYSQAISLGASRTVLFFERNVRFSKPCASADSHIWCASAGRYVTKLRDSAEMFSGAGLFNLIIFAFNLVILRTND